MTHGQPVDAAKMGGKMVLTEAEEDFLVLYIELLYSAGYPVTKGQVMYDGNIILDRYSQNTPSTDSRPGSHAFVLLL